MLIGVDDTSNNITTLGTFFFSMFVYICTLCCFVLIGGNLTTQFTGATGEFLVGFKFHLHPLPALPPEHPGELDCRLIMIC